MLLIHLKIDRPAQMEQYGDQYGREEGAAEDQQDTSGTAEQYEGMDQSSAGNQGAGLYSVVEAETGDGQPINYSEGESRLQHAGQSNEMFAHPGLERDDEIFKSGAERGMGVGGESTVHGNG